MSIFGSDYVSGEALFITEDIDMEGNRIKELRNPQDSNDAVNKRYMNKRIEYKTKDLENKLAVFKSNVDNANNENLQRLRLFNASIQQNKEEIKQLETKINDLNLEIESLESLPDTDEKEIGVLSALVNVNKAKIENVRNDAQNQLTYFQRLLNGTEPMRSNQDMGNNRIINLAHPRNPEENSEFEHDVVTAKFLYDFTQLANKKYLKADEDNVLDGRLDMKQHRIIGLADPVAGDGAVTKRYVASRFEALTNEIGEARSRIDRLERLL